MPNIKVVLVSPLFRALQTAYNMFYNHPNFKQIKFVMLPDLREILLDSKDIPKIMSETFHQFSILIPFGLIAENLPIKIPYRNQYSDLWFLENMDKKRKTKFYNQIKMDKGLEY